MLLSNTDPIIIRALPLLLLLLASCREPPKIPTDRPGVEAYQLGRGFARKGELASALSAYRRAVDQAPTEAAYRAAVVETLRQMGRLAEAEKEAEEARSRFPREPDVWRVSAQVALSRRLLDEALRYASRAVELGDTGRAHLLAGWVACERGDIASARSHLEAVRPDADGREDLRARRKLLASRLHLLEGRLEDARRVAEEAFTADPNLWPAWGVVGLSHQAEDAYQDAYQALTLYVGRAAPGDRETPFYQLCLETYRELQRVSEPR